MGSSGDLQSSRRATSPGGDLHVGQLVDTIIKGRKNWKRTKGDAETIWPEELEKALIEGLRAYVPVDSRETRLLGRFPLRNQFLSDYIHRTTGKIRTAKQVGSRLQQLRDPRSGKEIQKLLSHGVHQPPHLNTLSSPPVTSQPRYYACASSDGSSPPNSPSSSTFIPGHGHQIQANGCDTVTQTVVPSQQRVQITIRVLPPESPWQPHSLPSVDRAWRQPQFAPLSTGSSSSCASAVEEGHADHHCLPYTHPRPLSTIDPSVALISRLSLSATSLFQILQDGTCVHVETSPLEIPDTRHLTSLPQGCIVYRTALCPSYWSTICGSHDPTQYTIFHDVLPCSNLSTPSVLDLRNAIPIFSAVYQFRYPTSSSHPSQATTFGSNDDLCTQQNYSHQNTLQPQQHNSHNQQQQQQHQPEQGFSPSELAFLRSGCQPSPSPLRAIPSAVDEERRSAVWAVSTKQR